MLQLGPAFKDFADTAAAMAGLDAVVAGEISVAHLACALGKPLFLLLPFAADFRWLRDARIAHGSDRTALSAATIRRLGQCRECIAIGTVAVRSTSGQGGVN